MRGGDGRLQVFRSVPKGFLAALILSCLTILAPPSAKDALASGAQPWPNQSGDFRAMLTLISEAELKEFDKPSDQSVDVHELDRARHGDHVAIKLTFTGVALTSDGSADVTYDFQIVPPGGSGELDDKGLAVLKGKVPDRWGIFDNRRAPLLQFDPDYPPGTYKVVVTVTDNVAHRTLSMSKEIELTK